MKPSKEQKEINKFEKMTDMSKLKALSNLSLERPLTNEEYRKMISLAKKLNIKDGEWTT